MLNINPTAYPIPDTTQRTCNDDPPCTSSLGRQKRGVAFPADLWPQHSTLKISLIGMTPEQEQLTKNNINQWAPYVNLSFEFTDKPDGDVRIAADDKSYGGSSAVGTNAKKVPANKPTMLIGFAHGLTAKTGQTVMHEFGHALGLKHEHQYPFRSLDFNAENVYRDYEQNGQSRSEANDQLLKTFDARQVNRSPYDQKSIMHYGLPGNFFNNLTPTPDNYELSETDKQFISALYPKNR